MLVTFYGVRGSIAAPGPRTIKYGGNTSCVHVRLNDGNNIIFDAGTGIRELGIRMVQNDEPLLLLLSHGHWDHIQGYPFFAPIYQPDREIRICQSIDSNAVSLKAILEQMDGSTFPVHSEDLPSKITAVHQVDEYLDAQSFQTTRKPLNHPGGGDAYRIEEDGVSIAYITDNELDPLAAPQTTYAEWVDFCKGVDLLIHDAQYTEKDLPAKHGWGHSLISQVRQLAVDAQVKNLAMYHHDPERTDSELDEIAIESVKFFKSRNSVIGSYIASEGLVFELTSRKDSRVTTIDLHETNR
ncbi:MAG: MBL fold metallo-hydrolase [bacterium]|jgi:phosphoribosyl 1,2-cyclic phosphodiesterase|nr:MBL fold metallo-hydrolase [Gammaproteobacteria bacterium]HIL84717.1 MBL fold metallo-hydrolase [Pseudomonadales bacterium]